MSEHKLSVTEPVLLAGAGPCSPTDMTAAQAHARLAIAADGGAAHLLRAGITPHWVIGDGDSFDFPEGGHVFSPRYLQIAEQDSTDFQKVLHRVAAPLIIGIGFLQGRLDHSLAALSALLEFRDQPVILLGEEDLCFHCPNCLSLDLLPGARVSLFPLREVTCVASTGLQWPIDGLHMRPGGQIGTSNRATGPVEMELAGDGMLVMLPKAELGAAVSALQLR